MGENDNNWISKNEYVPNNSKININRDTDKTLRECIDLRLGPSILEKTKLNSNTQKVESVNHVIIPSLPKNVTYPRNFSGRSHSAIFSSNNGPGLVDWLIWVKWLFQTVFQSISGHLPERGRKRREKTEESKNDQTTPTRTYCKRNRPLPYYHPNCRTPRHWKIAQGHRTTRPPQMGQENQS